jgi:hypothetical protein
MYYEQAFQLPHPTYSPDITPSDFYLFGNLKEKHDSTVFTDRDSRLFAVTEIFTHTERRTCCGRPELDEATLMSYQERRTILRELAQ